MPAPENGFAGEVETNVQFDSIRLSGFKSFVDPVSLDIAEGLTGIVGPNGCGKSNLVEALRWVMGETSARRMRGGEMDDVIFAGTASRPAYNTAEVTLVVDNSGRDAPSALNDTTELNISRRIERSRGSQFRVNGRDVRGRDVQLLFADASSGARSAGIVRQGRIGSVISAKPSERRILLEEAANIRGLQSRRHEAELRLRAAEANLQRLEDILQTLDQQLQGLRSQAKQAVRYRKVSEQIRQIEAVVLHGRWRALRGQRESAVVALEQAETAVAAAASEAAREATRRTELAAKLPDLRRTEAERAAALQCLTLALADLDNEDKRIAQARTDAETRLRQTDADIERETALREDATENIESLSRQRNAATGAQDGSEERKAAAAGLKEAEAAVAACEAEIAALAGTVANIEARHGAFKQQARIAGERHDRLQQQLMQLTQQERKVVKATTTLEDIESARAAATDLQQQSDDAGRMLDATEEKKAAQSLIVEQARDVLASIDAATARLEAEAGALGDLLASDAPCGLVPAIDTLTVKVGYEAALGAALGEDLNAPVCVPGADVPQRQWTALARSGATTLPKLAVALDTVVDGPAELNQRLSQIGVVPDAGCADRLQPRLRQGQRLTTRAGGLWRWDGFTVAVGAPDGITTRMRQRNRKADIETRILTLATEHSKAEAALVASRASLEGITDRVQTERQGRRDARLAAEAARERVVGLERQQLEFDARLRGIAESRDRLVADRDESAEHRRTAEAEAEALPDTAELRRQGVDNRELLVARREALAVARSEHDRLVREAQDRQASLTALADALKSWSERLARATGRINDLTQRRVRETTEIARLAARPDEIRARRTELGDAVKTVGLERQAAADALAQAEAGLAAADSAGRAADRAVIATREERVRAEAAVAQHDAVLNDLRTGVFERFDCDFDELLVRAGVSPDAVSDDMEESEVRIERLIRERERIGAVNLRAEHEVAELEDRIAGMDAERNDLTGAINRLRRAVSALNREGRERLSDAFADMDRHFRDLFVRLFGGGRAHLELIEGNDPLDAGLEIMASPPGKKMQMLSLLSGGEQALTALALVFAAFLTSPSPLCILDEVDAPLDDSNVARFCKLVDDIARDTGTRFLIITHHRLTMARMDRLYGVTMAERGVSQLVSVELGQAVALRETA